MPIPKGSIVKVNITFKSGTTKTVEMTEEDFEAIRQDGPHVAHHGENFTVNRIEIAMIERLLK